MNLNHLIQLVDEEVALNAISRSPTADEARERELNATLAIVRDRLDPRATPTQIFKMLPRPQQLFVGSPAKLELRLATSHVVPSTTDYESVVRAAVDKVTAANPPNALLSVRDVRAVAGLPKAEFDKTILAMQKAREVDLHYHDFPSSLSQANRDLLVHDPTPSARDLGLLEHGAEPSPTTRGTHYVGIVRRQH